MIWIEFTSIFLRAAVVDNIAHPKDLPKTISVLAKVGASAGQNNPVSQLLRFLEEMNHFNTSSLEMKEQSTQEIVSLPASVNPLLMPPPASGAVITYKQSSSISTASLSNFVFATKRAEEAIDAVAKNDPMSLQQQVMILLDGWMRIINDLYAHEKSIQFLQLLQQNGIGKNEEQTERFVRSATDLLIEAVLKSATVDINAKDLRPTNTKVLNYAVIDAFGKLISLMVRQVGSGARNDQAAQQQMSLLNQVLGIIVRTMMANYERSKRDNGGSPLNWDQRPWFRLLLNLLMDSCAPSQALDPINFGIVSVFGAAFHIIQPLVMPGTFNSIQFNDFFSRFPLHETLFRFCIRLARVDLASHVFDQLAHGEGSERLGTGSSVVD
jgi:CCR4-NOT transcription complex subunit 1